MTTNWKLGLGLSLVTATMWGLLPLALKGALLAMDPVTISWYRFSVSAAIALLWFGAESRRALKHFASPRHLPFSLAVIAGLVGNYLLYIWGLDHINPGAAQILIQVAPLLLLGGSVFLFKEQFSPKQWLGVASLGIGLILFFHLRLANEVTTNPGYITGVVLTLAGAVAWSVYGLAQKRLLVEFHAKDILLLICLGGTFILLPLSEPAQILRLDGAELMLLAFCGLNTIVAYGCFGLAMSHWQASRVSAVITIAPLLTLLFTWILNLSDIKVAAEPMDWLSYFGALLVVTGASITALSGKEK